MRSLRLAKTRAWTLHPLIDGWDLARAEVRRFQDLLLGARGRYPSAGCLVRRREVGEFLGMRTVGKVGHQRGHEERAEGGAALRGQRFEVRLYEGQREFGMLPCRDFQDDPVGEVDRQFVRQGDRERFFGQFGIYGGRRSAM